MDNILKKGGAENYFGKVHFTDSPYEWTIMKQKFYEIANRKIVWLWDDEETKAANMTCDNLYILNSEGIKIWNMRDAMEHEDICVDMKVISDTDIRFITWNGWNVIFDAVSMKVKLKRLTK